jgi:hypothetical protein
MTAIRFSPDIETLIKILPPQVSQRLAAAYIISFAATAKLFRPGSR